MYVNQIILINHLDDLKQVAAEVRQYSSWNTAFALVVKIALEVKIVLVVKIVLIGVVNVNMVW